MLDRDLAELYGVETLTFRADLVPLNSRFRRSEKHFAFSSYVLVRSRAAQWKVAEDDVLSVVTRDLFVRIPLPLSFRLYAFIVASHSAEHESRPRFCPMTTTNTKYEHVTLSTASRNFQGRVGGCRSEFISEVLSWRRRRRSAAGSPSPREFLS